jgi:hypothetical protein
MEPSQEPLMPQYCLEAEYETKIILIPVNELPLGVSLLITHIPADGLQTAGGRTPASRNVLINGGRLNSEMVAQRMETDSPIENIETEVVYIIGEHGRRAVMGQGGLEWRETEPEDEGMISSDEEQRRSRRTPPVIQELDSEDGRCERNRSRRSHTPSVSPTRARFARDGSISNMQSSEGYHSDGYEGEIIIGYIPENRP